MTDTLKWYRSEAWLAPLARPMLGGDFPDYTVGRNHTTEVSSVSFKRHFKQNTRCHDVETLYINEAGLATLASSRL